MKTLKRILPILMLVILSACGDSNDEPQNTEQLFDWLITETTYEKIEGKIILQEQYIVYDKSEAYVLALKANFDRSTNLTRQFLTYKKLSNMN